MAKARADHRSRRPRGAALDRHSTQNDALIHPLLVNLLRRIRPTSLPGWQP